MNKQMIQEIALANGFKLKPQAICDMPVMDLNPYVYNFAEALEQHILKEARERLQHNALIPRKLTHFDYVAISNDQDFFDTYQTILAELDSSEDSAVILIQTIHKALVRDFEQHPIFKVGYLVAPISHEYTLASGCGRYDSAYVVNVDPFQLMSVEGDMYWSSTAKPEGFKVLDANAQLPEKVKARMVKEGLLSDTTSQVKQVSAQAQSFSECGVFDYDSERRLFESLHASDVLFERVEYVPQLCGYMAKPEFQDSMIVMTLASLLAASWATWQIARKGVMLWVAVADEEPPLNTDVLIAWEESPDIDPDTDYMDVCVDTGNHYWANYHNDKPSHWMHVPKLMGKVH